MVGAAHLMAGNTAGPELQVSPLENTQYIHAKQGEHWCATQEQWDLKKESLVDLSDRYKAGCPTEGMCDFPANRDATQMESLTINVVVHVMRDGSGNGGVSESTVWDSINEMNFDYANNGTGLQFQVSEIQFHNDDAYDEISAYSYSGKYAQDIAGMKAKYAVNPTQYLNIYVSAQKQGRLAVLLGIGTFPWDADALTAQGGLWMNNIAMGAGGKTMSHEMGHCLGLWHTHHGVSEVTSCADCYEFASGQEGDIRGDFADDTPPTQTNYNCSAPGGTDCQGTSWGATQPENIMGYGPDTCLSYLSPKQARRVQCWTKDALAGLVGGGGTGNLPPSASFTVSTNLLNASFNASGSNDPDGNIVSYAWNFGDNSSGSGVTTNHAYASAGTYNVTLTVTDNDGATNTTSQSVSVNDGTGDVTPPVISNVSSASTGGRNFRISWTTDEPADSVVIFTGSAPFSDSNLVTEHSMSFRGSRNVSYEYSVQSTDASGNTSTAGPFVHNN